MTVLVMGAAGNVGGAIVQALRERELGSRPSAGMSISGRPGSMDRSPGRLEDWLIRHRDEL